MIYLYIYIAICSIYQLSQKRGDAFSLQRLLGHSRLEMVRRYVTLDSAQVRAQHRKFSPMDRMNLGRAILGRMYQNRPSNGNGLTKKCNAVKNGS